MWAMWEGRSSNHPWILDCSGLVQSRLSLNKVRKRNQTPQAIQGTYLGGSEHRLRPIGMARCLIHCRSLKMSHHSHRLVKSCSHFVSWKRPPVKIDREHDEGPRDSGFF